MEGQEKIDIQAWAPYFEAFRDLLQADKAGDDDEVVMHLRRMESIRGVLDLLR
jgi:hypothetical protein